MKKLIIVATIIIFYFGANAQNRDRYKSGNYIRTEAKNIYVGRWIADEPEKELEFSISTKRTHIKGGELNYYIDAIYVEIKKCIYKGENLAKKIHESIMLDVGDASKYSSGPYLKDPITGDDIIIKLYYINKDSLKLNVNTRYSPGTSTIFPLGNTILKRKKK